MQLAGLANHKSLVISIFPLDKIEIQSHPIDLISNKISTTFQLECSKTKLFLAFQMLQQTKGQIKAKKDDFTLPSKEFNRNKSNIDDASVHYLNEQRGMSTILLNSLAGGLGYREARVEKEAKDKN